MGDIVALWHLKSRKKPSGGILKRSRKKSRRNRGSDFLEVGIGRKKLLKSRGLGGRRKLRALAVKEANVLDPGTGKYQKVEIGSVEENPANQHYARRDTVTKGAVVKTDIGLAKVTSRPSRDGVVNAVMVESKKSK